MKKYLVTLTEEERAELKSIAAKGRHNARTIKRAQILLHVDQGEHGEFWTDIETSKALSCSLDMCEEARKRFVTDGLEAALHHKRYEHQPRKITGEVEAALVAVACSQPPEGQTRWTLIMLANRLVELELVENVSSEHVRRILKKTKSNRGSKSNG